MCAFMGNHTAEVSQATQRRFLWRENGEGRDNERDVTPTFCPPATYFGEAEPMGDEPYNTSASMVSAKTQMAMQV